jgi:two-component system, NtrC family, sensor kinase
MAPGEVYDITQFTLEDMVHCGASLRAMGEGAASMDEVAGRIAAHFHGAVCCPDGKRASALVRLYKTHRFEKLPSEIQRLAERRAGQPLAATTTCVTLLGSAGEEPAWRSRRTSENHQAIPVVSEESLAKMLMLEQLVTQLGIDKGAFVRGEAPSVDEARGFDVFHVPTAEGSPFIPAQAFVRDYRVRSVIGFGGTLPDGEIFLLVLFAKVAIPRETAELFGPLALNAKLAIQPFVGRELAPAEAGG